MARKVLPPVPTPLIDVEVVAAARRRSPLAVLVPAPDGDTGWETADAALFTGQRATGKPGEVRTVGDPASRALWLVGVGGGTAKDYRTAGAALIRAADAHVVTETEADARPSRTAQAELPDGAGPAEAAEFALGAALGGYTFTLTADDPKPRVRTLRLVVGQETAVAPVTAAVGRALELAAASALARDLANTPSNVKDPVWLAGTAERVAAAASGLSVTVRDERWLAEQGFGGVLAVGGGSASPPRLIELSYRPRGATTHILLVGKGITFDTGGISIKPADGMHLMRTDMAGGGAVIAAARAIANLRLPVRVTALVPSAENHVSGSSYRPGDVVRHYGGTTTEVGNTDAEGRMVLADALAYGIRKFSPDVVVDVATLTGAMKLSLGVRTGGLFATEDALAERVAAAGERAGEAWWRMPLLEDLAGDVRGEIADLRQAPQGPGGIVAALFLREFTGGLPWAHLDIAGPGRSERNYAEVVPGGTGFAARTLVEFAASYA
ncbi:peptidase M17 [Amycolatopsis antarctica]|uniref:Probable cytosol aminopeptidase n=1 Tax=Amycolatopsis antarctica TaxID=1854586 RepID=A0A263D9C7_9PSEU|nr:leucyl aminopeptidase family protein [Amycolatopsis antarctica]OZM75122.1 peptidase M17 [Amycolatopsis antarctica]